MAHCRVAILGGGPAGLAAAWRLRRFGKAEAVVVERGDDVGGNAGSFECGGMPVDYGSHRLHPSCRPEILRDLSNLMGTDLLDRPRRGRIRLRGRWIGFPLRPLDLLLHLPPSFLLGAAADGARGIVSWRADDGEETFAGVLEHGLGATICREFYFPYAVKIWGVRPEQLSAVQARRRVSAGSLRGMVRKALALVPGLKAPGAGRFFYPRGGFGQISRAIADAARAEGAEIRLGTTVRRVELGSPHRVVVECGGSRDTIEAEHVWSTIPVSALAGMVTPPAPGPQREAGRRIEYRAMVLIYLVLERPRFTPFDAHYFPQADIRLTRLSEPKNYSARGEPADSTVLCGELPCTVDDAVWRSSDEELADLTREALACCALPIRAPIREVITRRLRCAYPIYRRGYEANFAALDEWIGGLDRVLTFGRQGLFAHDNTHHTLAMAYAAANCLDARGSFDAARWRGCREEFEAHVVED